MKVYIDSYGCTFNKADGQIMAGVLNENNIDLVDNIDDADVVIVNTCSFIHDAMEESVNTVLEMAELKKERLKYLIVTGCLAQRFKDEIFDEIPEVDAVVGIGANGDIAGICKKVLEGKTVAEFPSKYCLPLEGDRILSTPPHYAYLKIAEGCDNKCTYCAIPGIRGPFRSRAIDDLVKEARGFATMGVKEIIVVAQDTTRYGIDISEHGNSLLHGIVIAVDLDVDCFHVRAPSLHIKFYI